MPNITAGRGVRWLGVILAPVLAYGVGAMALQIAATELGTVSERALGLVEIAVVVVTAFLTVLSGSLLAPRRPLSVALGIAAAIFVLLAAQVFTSPRGVRASMTAILAHAAGAGAAVLVVWWRHSNRRSPVTTETS